MSAIRDQCVKRAKGRCEACEKFRFLFWHHIFFRSSHAEERLETTCMICLECHNYIHDHRDGYKLDVSLKLWSQEMLKALKYTMEEIRIIVGGKLYFIEDIRGKNARTY